MKVITALLFFSVSFFVLSKESTSWFALRDNDMRVVPGTALDFSTIFNTDSSPSRKLIVNHKGKLAFSDNKDTANRFLCAPLLFPKPQGLFPSKSEIESLAEQMRIQGYNLANIRFVDGILMEQANEDFGFNPTQLDRFHYLLYQLKKNGIYWMLDVATSWNGGYAINNGHRYMEHYDLDLDVHFKKESQNHWKKLANTILNVTNPYTKLKIIEDQNLAILTLFNENGIAFQTRKDVPSYLKERYQRWLKEQKKTDVLKLNEMYSEFLTSVENETLIWMSDYLREINYQGIITAYNNGKTIQSTQVRNNLDLISVHAYHGHPSNFIREGSKIKNSSLISDGLPLIQYLSTVRMKNKPFIVDEYDQPYWSEWRREVGYLLPAYASFQNWDGICRFSNPVLLGYSSKSPKRQTAIYPFGVGMDPVAQAGETLSALLFRRGDVRVGDTNVNLVFKPGESKSNSKRILPLQSSKVSLFFRTAMTLSNLDVDSEHELNGFSYVSKVDKFINHLKMNKSNSAYSTQSKIDSRFDIRTEGGEIYISTEIAQAIIDTPKTEAIVIGDSFDEDIEISSAKILNSSKKIAFSISSLEAKEIHNSERLLITFITNARNTGDEYSDDGRQLIKHGSLPIEIKDGFIKVKLTTRFASEIKLYSLSLNGLRKETIGVTRGEKYIMFHLEQGKLKSGPTFYFELSTNKYQDILL